MNKRKFKKFILGALLGTSLAGTSAFPTMAAGVTTITVNGEADSYAAYRLMDTTARLKPNCGHTGSSHTEDCYTYYYSVNSKYGTALRSAAADAGLAFDADGNGAVTDKELLSGLHAMDASDTRTYAETLYGKVSSLSPDYRTDDKVFADVPYGYYLMGETGDGSGAVALLEAVGTSAVTAETKQGVPTLTKKILNGSKRVDAVDIAKGDTVNYEVSVTMPEDLSSRPKYAFTIHNTGRGAVNPGSVKLYVDGKEVVNADSVAPPSETGYTFSETITQDEKWLCNCGAVVSGNTDNHVLNHVLAGEPDNGRRLKLSNLKYVSNGTPVILTPDNVVTLTYAETLSEGLTTKSTGNASESWMEYAADRNAASMKETPHDKVTAFTYQFRADKVDEDGEALAGADFTLERKKGSNWVGVPYEAGDGMSFTFLGLDSGTYRLTESAVPEGYQGAGPVEFTIQPAFDEVSDNPRLSGLSISGTEAEDAFSIDVPNGTVSTQVVNTIGGTDIRLPSTGEVTGLLLYAGGTVLILGGLFSLYQNRKKGA